MADWNKYFKRPSWIPRWLNIPLLIFAGFIVWLLFFGENNYMRINDYKKQINELKSEIKQNEDSARIYDAKMRELNTDHETLERIVREQYGMKRVNEDVYVTDIP
ncbi:MAG: septum formation initiator family protein [Muribaculaceae bacterium]|nr:septum formation initiator family protein [Muribaculaceae bacterium]